MNRAYIDISTEILGQALALFPRTYRVIGSASSIAPDTVRLVVASEYIAQDLQVMTCEVQDEGNARTVRMMRV